MLHLNKKAEIQILASREVPDDEDHDQSMGVDGDMGNGTKSGSGVVEYVMDKLRA